MGKHGAEAVVLRADGRVGPGNPTYAGGNGYGRATPSGRESVARYGCAEQGGYCSMFRPAT